MRRGDWKRLLEILHLLLHHLLHLPLSITAYRHRR